MRSTLVTAVVLLVFSVVFWIGADAIPKSRLGGTVGADGLPKLLALALGILSIGLIAQSLIAMRAVGPVEPVRKERTDEERAAGARALGMIAIGFGYLLAVPYLGYLVTIGLLLLTVALYNGKRLSRGLLLFVALGALGFYLLFVRLLDVPLPAGFWPRLLT
jgi:putative tricarboxylic transport membrane protein